MTWLLSSPEGSLAYILADSGFDVWVVNNRGTRWSSRHVSLDSYSRRYWDWSWDDLVVNDMPSLVDYVCSHTGQKPHFLGHSMGTLVALAAFSEGRTVDKLKSAVLLTPVAYLSHMTTPLGILLAKAFVGEAGGGEPLQGTVPPSWNQLLRPPQRLHRLTVQYLEQFAHADFVIGTCAKDYVYNHVVSFFNRFN
ncbi:unnamed protein product [Triticum turgidum subsp. durum]|uniref:AB hydrolase-1 domain-containing protein n=1 Tax=Triticum turgidum subsp. durum TaxID=4567 RepID=A0A9R0ZYS4_TRITD|nr:unnamed protein product [Triticum turgidum subsp. durum]